MKFVVVFAVIRKAGTTTISYNGSIFKDGDDIGQFSIPCEDYGDFKKWWQPKIKELANGAEYKAHDHQICTVQNNEPFYMDC